MSGEQYIDFATQEGLFKHNYEDKLVRTVPSFADCQKVITFSNRRRIGDEYRIPLALQLEAGITWAQQADGAFSLELPIAGTTRQAAIQGSCHVLRSAISYVAAFAGEDPEQAFESTTGSTVKNAWEAMRRFLEGDILYGQDDDGIGVVGAIAGAAKTPNNGNVPANSIQITAATWAPGLWVEGAKCEVFKADHTVIRNAAAPIITAVDLDERVVTFDTLPAAAIATDVVHYKTQHTASGGGGAWKTMAGLKKIITNAGTLFGIDASVYNKWRGNIYDCGSAPLSFLKIGKGASKILAKGGAGNRFIMWVGSDSWVDLNSDVDALRMDDTSGYKPGKIELGHESITYHTVVGPVEIRAHAMVKASEAFLIPTDGFERIGSTDITFDRSKMTGLKGTQGSFLRELENNAGFEFRGFSHQAVMTERPGFAVYFKNITPTT